MSEEIWALAEKPGAALVCHLESGEVLHANAAALEMLRKTKALGFLDERSGAGSNGRFAEYLTILGAIAAGRAAFGMMIVPAADRGEVYALSIQLPGHAPSLAAHEANSLRVVFVHIKSSRIAPSGEFLRAFASAYALTPAETMLVSGLCSGKTLEELAETGHIAASTLRQRMKSVLAKTRMPRQSELMRLIFSLAAP